MTTLSNSEAFTPDACLADNFAFIYKDLYYQTVNGTFNEQTGLCTFPDANCGVDVPVFLCCHAKPEEMQTGDNYMFIGTYVTNERTNA